MARILGQILRYNIVRYVMIPYDAIIKALWEWIFIKLCKSPDTYYLLNVKSKYLTNYQRGIIINSYDDENLLIGIAKLLLNLKSFNFLFNKLHRIFLDRKSTR